MHFNNNVFTARINIYVNTLVTVLLLFLFLLFVAVVVADTDVVIVIVAVSMFLPLLRYALINTAKMYVWYQS